MGGVIGLHLMLHITTTFQVDLSLSFVDTADDDATTQISGELTYNDGGENVPFSSYGMIEIRLSSGNNSLTAKGVWFVIRKKLSISHTSH